MSIYLNADCMNPETGLPSYPDNYFDLAIVDPPYEVDMSGGKAVKDGFKSKAHWDKMAGWDLRPNSDYFKEVFRVSRNQIIWGANYYPQYLTPSMGWIFWDKMQHGFSFSDGELAFSSFDVSMKVFQYGRGCESGFAPKLKEWEKGFANLHPTQKPMGLYRWLVNNYAKQGDKILDTHVGSASSLVVYEEMGFEYVGFELDPDYYRDSCKRLEAYRAQPKLFTGSEIFEASKPKSLFDTDTI